MQTLPVNKSTSFFSAQTVERRGPQRSPGSTLELTGPDTFIGDPVYNHKGEHLGSIQEIMLDLQSGKISHAVMSQGEAFYSTGKMVAIAWDILAPGAANSRFLLHIDKSCVDDAPGFTYDNWPDTSDPAWSALPYSICTAEVD
jgi:hypothetical protein